MPKNPEALTRRPYVAPRLVRHGHMAAVTGKSGAFSDASQTWPNRIR